MKRIVMVFIVTVGMAALMAGCGGDKGKELLDTAQFEEKQNNLPHAVQLYEEIVRKYPGSEAAKQAGVRLEELKKRRP